MSPVKRGLARLQKCKKIEGIVGRTCLSFKMPDCYVFFLFNPFRGPMFEPRTRSPSCLSSKLMRQVFIVYQTLWLGQIWLRVDGDLFWKDHEHEWILERCPGICG